VNVQQSVYYAGIERTNVNFDKRICWELKQRNCVALTMRMLL